jgi:hypothetical protein
VCNPRFVCGQLRGRGLQLNKSRASSGSLHDEMKKTRADDFMACLYVFQKKNRKQSNFIAVMSQFEQIEKLD